MTTGEQWSPERPAEVLEFMEANCRECRGSPMREGIRPSVFADDELCRIRSASFVALAAEWRDNDDGPRFCTAFVGRDDTPDRCFFTVDIFPQLLGRPG